MVKEYKIRVDKITHERIFKIVERLEKENPGRTFIAADVIIALLDNREVLR